MNQIFRITIGQETISGKLPTLRVGQGYSALFYISGIKYEEGCTPPKVWVKIGEQSYYWEAQWLNGVWQCLVTANASQTITSKDYAITMGGGADEKDNALPEYIAGQGKFVVYPNIATSGSSGETEGGQTITGQLAALDQRLTVVEGKIGEMPTNDDLNSLLDGYVDKSSLSSGIESIQQMPTDTPAQREARLVALLNLLFGL